MSRFGNLKRHLQRNFIRTQIENHIGFFQPPRFYISNYYGILGIIWADSPSTQIRLVTHEHLH